LGALFENIKKSKKYLHFGHKYFSKSKISICSSKETYKIFKIIKIMIFLFSVMLDKIFENKKLWCDMM
jgi:hypothetical protein